jgi:micrococcal nuclease
MIRGGVAPTVVAMMTTLVASSVLAAPPVQSDVPWPIAVRAIDARTIRVAMPGAGLEEVRVIGVEVPDAPRPGAPDACHGREATTFVRTRILGGTKLVLIADPLVGDRDGAGRLLRHVILEADPNDLLTPEAPASGGITAPLGLAQMLLEGGHGRASPVTSLYEMQLRLLEADAREAGRGLWSPSTCDGRVESSDPTISAERGLVDLSVPSLELPPAIRAIFGDWPGVTDALKPGQAAVATTIAVSANSMATTVAIVTAIPTFAASYDTPRPASPSMPVPGPRPTPAPQP